MATCVANDPSDLTGMGIGSVQSLSYNGLAYPYVDSFRFSNDLFDGPFPDAEGVTYNSYSQFFDFPTDLPGDVNGNYWTYDPASGRVNVDIPSSGDVQYAIRSAAFTFTREITEVCPVASFISADGCYNCQAGSEAHIIARSDCLSGSASLSVNVDYITLSTRYILLSEASTKLLINFVTTQAMNDFTITITSDSGKSANVIVSFVAVNGENIGFSNTTVINPTENPAPPVKHHKKHYNWHQWLRRLFRWEDSWVKSFFLYIGIIAIAVIGLAVMLCGLPAIVSAMSRPKWMGGKMQ